MKACEIACCPVFPQPENLAEYRQEVSALLEKNERGLRRQKWYAGALWVWVVLLGAVFFLLSGRLLDAPSKAGIVAWIGSLACFSLIGAAAELLKHFINRARVELLKETKQVQLQLLELQNMLRKPGV